MSIIDSLEKRRSYYKINKELPLSEKELEEKIKRVTELVPDAFNMKSARVVILWGAKSDELWDMVYRVFNGAVSRQKIDSFKAGAGTILFFYDEKTIEEKQEKFVPYADKIPLWANQANGMLQIALWCLLRDLNIGASLQHYNPAIDLEVKELFSIPESYHLIAEMPFGGIVTEPPEKKKEDITARVTIQR